MLSFVVGSSWNVTSGDKVAEVKKDYWEMFTILER